MCGEIVRFLVRFVAIVATVDNTARREIEQDEGGEGGRGMIYAYRDFHRPTFACFWQVIDICISTLNISML
jgi:hypothetical protein